jgi:hypothetical protein
VCGNGKCEDFETCTNCAKDCGECQTLGCIEIVTCAFTCIDFAGNPPKFSLSCVAQCVALGCADVQFFVDQVVNCAIMSLGSCMDLNCIMAECGDEITACIGATC